MSQAPSGTVTFLFTDIECSTHPWELDGIIQTCAEYTTTLIFEDT